MTYTRTTMPFQAIAVAGLLLLSSAAFAQAQPTPTTDKKTDVQTVREKAQALKAQVQQKKAEAKEAAEAARTAQKEAMSAAKQVHVNGIINALEMQVRNLESLTARVESRIAKFGAKGADTTASRAALADTKTKIADAQAAVEALKMTAQTSIATSTPKSTVAVFTTAARNAEAKLRLARMALVNAINSLKPGKNNAKNGNDDSAQKATTTSQH